MEFDEFNYATKPGHIAYIPLTRHTRFDVLFYQRRPPIVGFEIKTRLARLRASQSLIKLPEHRRVVSAINARQERVGVVELGVFLAVPAP
jgi:hypothetical protein